ncbi:hypothetical protein M900_0635 [Bacteriovorax sp. Seq25_V]|nr:hypothetical protein M900_0635 [Bacteriovorax sp. Seq25_V]
MFAATTAGIGYWQILPDEQRGSTVSKESFEKIIENTWRLYHVESAQKGRVLVVKTKDWNTSYFSAWANKESDGTFSINFWGGLARLPYMTDAAFVLTACHEIGHIIGGDPMIKNKYLSHMSSEGQSDYFASTECMRKYDVAYGLDEVDNVDPYITSRCYENFEEASDFETCLKIAVAGASLTRNLSLLNGDEEVHADTPSQNIVENTIFDSYPSVQCRLDTFIAGALNEERPACWFAATDAEHIDKAR